MGLYGDLEETKRVWKNASWQTRLIVLVFLFLTVSSITNVADVVFKWKGFILDGVVFYQMWIRDPIATALSFIKIPPNIVDLLIPCSMALSMSIKVDKGSEERSWGHTFLLMPLMFIVGFILVYISESYFPEQKPFLILVSFIVVLGLVYKFNPTERKSYFYIFGGVLLFILLLAAINTGLTRTS